MKNKIFIFFLILLTILISLIILLVGAFYFDIFWRSPAYYPLKSRQFLKTPIMDMKTYSEQSGHRRPYIYQLKGLKGSVYVIGIEHTKDSQNPQLDSIRQIWASFQPNLALVEGRLGFLFSPTQNPVEKYGESGLTTQLAKKNGVSLYTWETERNTEVQNMLRRFPAYQLALFYSLRPYFSDFRFGKPTDPDAVMQNYIINRTKYEGLQGQIRSVAQLDSIWKRDFPNLKDWRETSDEYGYPEGYLADIFNVVNIERDEHLCSIIIEAMQEGKKVLVTMGSSHAYRIEKSLRSTVK